jgi:phospholipid/cholesterol/gamma-HCH transport system ATP-binding protein
MIASAPAPVISVEDVTIAYGSNVVQKDISFEVRRGEVFVILGGSGCGKSSLLKNMIGLYRPPRGRILIEGEDIVTAEGEDRLRLFRSFGVMYQSGALFGSMTVLENVCLPLDEFTDLGPPEKELVAAAKLNLVGLLEAAARKPAALSGGMQKRAGIARAMALDPRILFLDEPSAGLDPITSAGLDKTIRELSMGLGITFVVVTHELQSIYAIADRCVMLDARTKTMIAEGKPADLRDHSDNPYVRQFFLRQAEAAPSATQGDRTP